MFDLTLTFDDGPNPEVTPSVLEALSERGILATFFVIGERLREHRDLAERARADGHRIGNHTWTHSVPLGDRDGPETVEIEIEQAQVEIGPLADPARPFRPFAFGVKGPRLLNRRAAAHLREKGYTCVLWNAVPRDWVHPDDWVEIALDMCRAQPWTCLVLHDLPTGAMRQLPRFLDLAAGAGAVFRQEFPPDCTPIDRGRITAPLSPYVAGGWPDDDASNSP